MDFEMLEASVTDLVECGDFIGAYSRIRTFESRATGHELGLCLGLRGALARRLSPANSLEALGLLEEALDLLEARQEARLEALVNTLQLCAEVGDPSRGLGWAEEFAQLAADLADRPGLLPWIGRGYLELGTMLARARGLAAAVDFYRQAAEIFVALRDQREAQGWERRARMGLADVYMANGRYWEAECECRVLLPLDLGAADQLEVHVRMAQVAMRTGRFAEAERWLAEASAAGGAQDTPGAARWMLARSELENRRGQHGLARGYRRIAQRMAADLRQDHLLHEASQGTSA